MHFTAVACINHAICDVPASNCSLFFLFANFHARGNTFSHNAFFVINNYISFAVDAYNSDIFVEIMCK